MTSRAFRIQWQGPRTEEPCPFFLVSSLLFVSSSCSLPPQFVVFYRFARTVYLFASLLQLLSYALQYSAAPVHLQAVICLDDGNLLIENYTERSQNIVIKYRCYVYFMLRSRILIYKNFFASIL